MRIEKKEVQEEGRKKQKDPEMEKKLKKQGERNLPKITILKSSLLRFLQTHLPYLP